MTWFSARFKKIQSVYGPDSLAILSTGQMACEEMALLGAMAKFGMGIRHLDSNTRQCMATAAIAYNQSFGFDAPPYTYDDFEQSDCLVFIAPTRAWRTRSCRSVCCAMPTGPTSS